MILLKMLAYEKSQPIVIDKFMLLFIKNIANSGLYYLEKDVTGILICYFKK